MAHWRKRIHEARVFVDKEFGRGMSASKVVSMIRPSKVMSKHPKEVYNREEVKGRHVSVGKSGRKQVVFISANDTPTIIHELTHSASGRRRSIKSLTNFLPAEETLAYSMELEWLRRNDVKKYSELLRVARKAPLGKKDIKKMDVHDFAVGAAAQIERITMLEDRQKVRSEMDHKYFVDRQEMMNWLYKRINQLEKARGFSKLSR